MGVFFGESFERRTGKPLEIVAGDQALAALIALRAPSRPSLYLGSPLEYLPRVTRKDIDDKGAVVVWPAIDSAGGPPPEIIAQFPNLVTEVPRAFSRRYEGRMPLTRIGWGMIRPHSQAGTPEETAPQPQPQVPPPQPPPSPPPAPLPQAVPLPPPEPHAQPQHAPQQTQPPPAPPREPPPQQRRLPPRQMFQQPAPPL
jgi:outer membrane biosynthesis protein TonB